MLLLWIGLQGVLVGPPNEQGQPVNVSNAMDHVFGMVLCNDWSGADGVPRHAIAQ